MRNNYIFLFLLAVLPLSLCAEKVTHEQALKTATKFMSEKTFAASKSYRRVRGTSSKDEPFYVFNASEGGFVIVSGDDRTSEILGYSSTGTLDIDDLPANLQWWLDEYARQIEGLGTTTVAKKTSLKASTASAISPLIHTQWNQYEPYNLMCPDGNGRDYYESGYNASNRCLTGCVATAMAQIMNYWQWPESCPELPAYNTTNYTIKALPSTTFKWGLMKNSYSYEETGDAASAVAELMRYCGQVVNMNYTPNSSAADVSRKAMVETFSYSNAIKHIYRNSYDLETWENIIYTELAEGRPVLYCGYSEITGHEFIVDGYDSNGLFHINWGWGGYQDNYFVLSVADPTAGVSSSGGFRYYQNAMVGIIPSRDEAKPYAMLSDDGLTVTFYYDSQKESRRGIDISKESVSSSPYGNATTAVIDASFAGYRPISTAYWFSKCSLLTSVTGMENLNTSNVTDMNFMFSGCSALTSLDLSGFNTSNVTSMEYMFYHCSKLTSLDLSSFNTSNVTYMSFMFSDCSKLTSLDLSGFNTSNVKEMRGMFCRCSKLTSLDLSGFNTSNVTSMEYMFYNCSSLKSLDISGFKTDMVTSMYFMFRSCSSLTSLDLSGFNTPNVADMRSMFYNCSNLETIYAGERWSTAHDINGHDMFRSCYKLTGGQGTKYNKGHTDYTYARLDGGNDAPGYFTEKTDIPGDANGNGIVEIGDVTSVLTLMATPEATGYDKKAADANGNGEIEIGDVTTILTIMAGGE